MVLISSALTFFDSLTIWLSVMGLVITVFTVMAFYNIYTSKEGYKKDSENFEKIINENKKLQIGLQKSSQDIDVKLKEIQNILDFKILYFDALSKYNISQVKTQAYAKSMFHYRMILSAHVYEADLDEISSIISVLKKAELKAPDSEKTILLQNIGACYILKTELISRNIKQEKESISSKYKSLLFQSYSEGIKYLNQFFDIKKSLVSEKYIGGLNSGSFSELTVLISDLQASDIFAELEAGNKLLYNLKEAFEFEYNITNITDEIGKDKNENYIYAYVRLLSVLKLIINKNDYTGISIIENEINKFREIYEEKFFQSLLISKKTTP